MSIDLFPPAILRNADSIQRLFASLFYFSILLIDCEDLCKLILHTLFESFGCFVDLCAFEFHKLPQTQKNPRSNRLEVLEGRT